MKQLRQLFAVLFALWLASWVLAGVPAAQDTSPQQAGENVVRVATYNVSMYRFRSGELVDDLRGGANEQARQIAEVVQKVRPGILSLNEFDYDEKGLAAQLFHDQYLDVSQNDQPPIEYPYRFTAASNTGLPTTFDLNRDGELGGPADAVGFGWYPGQYGMVVYSKFPIDRNSVRTFRNFLWKDVPDAKLPVDPATGDSYYSDQELETLRLSSKSIWDVPVTIRKGRVEKTLHFICSHPTPPVFDGPEDRNGLRNHDEIRILADYIDPTRSGYLVDDTGLPGGLSDGKLFVIAGDLNADPNDGGSYPGAVAQLLNHPTIDSRFIPTSEGGNRAAAARPDLNAPHQGDPSHDTADFSGDEHGNLRVDYLLPSRTLTIRDAGVYWPSPGEAGSNAISATDHRLVWIDVAWNQ